jgi:creatinine amidohydrolase/Fe(II)-dependent formamide hydrolase-like protein
MQRALMILIASAALATATAASQQRGGRSTIHKLDELTASQIAALDRERTLFILPVGMLEQHGPHLPLGADTLAVVYEADGAARRVARDLAGWSVVMMPAVNDGQSGANRLGDQRYHPGTYSIRQATLRSLIADIGGQLAVNGFKWIFVTNGHGAPTHNIALNEACDFVSETYGVTMLHLTALFRGDPAIQAVGEKIAARHFSPVEIASFGMDVHAGLGETSGMLAVRPDLVRPMYKTLPSRAGASIEELRRIATSPGWQGYLSSPARATAAYGRAVEEWWVNGFADLILRTVQGENMFKHPRTPDAIPAPIAPVLEAELAEEQAFQMKLEDWLARRRQR